MTYTHAACAGIQKDSTLTLRPKFKVVPQGHVAGVRDGEAGGCGGVKGDGNRQRAEEESDFTTSSSDFTASSSDEQVEDEEEEYILFRPRARMSAGVGSSGKSGSPNADILVGMSAVGLLTTMSAGMSAVVGSSGESASPKSSPAAATAASEFAANAPTELQILVDRRTWKMQYEYEKLGEQEFRARAVLIKPEGGREELAWSPASGSKQKAKHAAAEIGLLACSTMQPPPNSSPPPASATNAPTELQILVDRQKWKMLYEYERLGEQEFRARVRVIKSEGVEEELAWSQPSGSKSKAKHAAAEIGLRRLSCLQSCTKHIMMKS
jgi:hypothetical protein